MSPTTTLTPADDPVLRETLKRCSPATYYAACKFRQTGQPEDLRLVLLGVIERYVERDLRSKLRAPDDTLRLSEDLGLDSLTMMEIVMVAEEVLQICVSNEEFTHLRTLGDVQHFVATKLASPRISAAAATSSVGATENWDLAAVGEQVRRIEASAVAPINRLAD